MTLSEQRARAAAYTLLVGDCIASMRDLPDASVHCCVTSPPYFGLRDYGHEGQIGLEDTPDAFVARLVEVFREVRRVLRDDGTLWLNLGSSYAGSSPGRNDADRNIGGRGGNKLGSGNPGRQATRGAGGKRASQSPERLSDPACGTHGKEPLGCSAPDCAYRGRGGEPLDGSPNHRDRNADTGRPAGEAGEPHGTTGRDSERQGSGEASLAASPRAAQASRTRASFRRDRDACVPVGAASACPLLPQTSAGDAGLSDHTSVCTCGTGSTSDPSGPSTSGKPSSDLACDCGSCGICWANLAIPLLSIKAKDSIEIPHLVALALQADGWFLRQTIVWSKLNPMPESVRDRCTKAHEYVFLLSKSPRYRFDAEAIKEPVAQSSVARLAQPTLAQQAGSARVPGKTNGNMKAVGNGETRNRRSVWTVTTKPFKGAHFATFPPDLIEPCILAGCPVGGTVLDPFGGSGTTAGVAVKHGRRAILCELNPDYADLVPERVAQIAGQQRDMFLEAAE